ncbi:Protein stu-1 like protein [Verticillium longisporum]|nr:Protein stu-1 like protein [Verticillium longisporum]
MGTEQHEGGAAGTPFVFHSTVAFVIALSNSSVFSLFALHCINPNPSATGPLHRIHAPNLSPPPPSPISYRGMAEKISDDQVENLLRVLRSDAAVDAKVNHVTALKSGIKQHNVPDHLVPSIFDALRLASSSQHAVLVNAGFTSLNHLLTRLSRQEPKFLNRELKAPLPLVIDKLGDQKEKFRTLAAQALTTLYAVAPADVERMVRNIAMAGKNPRAKEAGMQWVLQMHQEQGLQFRGYVPTLMDLLEDADGMVRDVAKATVIELFRFNDADLPVDTWKIMMYSEILDYHNVDANVAQLEEQLNAQAAQQ